MLKPSSGHSHLNSRVDVGAGVNSGASSPTGGLMGVLAENDDDEGAPLTHPNDNDNDNGNINDDGTSGPSGGYVQARALPPLGLALAGNGDGVVFVVEVVPDSVADKSGIEAGDQLLGVGYMPLPQLALRGRRASGRR